MDPGPVSAYLLVWVRLSELRQTWFRPRRPASLGWVMVLVAVVGLGGSLLVARGLRLAEQRVFEIEFGHRAKDRATVIERQLRRSVAAIESIAALYAASYHVDRDEFRAFTSAILEHNPGIRALGYDRVVRTADREAYEASLRAEGYADFAITERDDAGRLIPAASREAYVSVAYLEPLAGNEAALGYDIASEPVRRSALVRASETGKAAITAPLRLVQQEKQGWGVLIMVPIYRAEAPTAAGPWAGIDGFAVGALQVAGTVDHALSSLQPGGLQLRVADITAGTELEALHLHRSRTLPAAAAEPAAGSMYQASFAFDIAGRRWSVLATPTAALEATAISSVPLAVFALGVLLTVLLVGYLGLQNAVTRRLQQALLERNRAQERQVGFGRMLDESHDEIYVFDSHSLRFLHVNRGGRENTGYSMNELRGMTPTDLKPQETLEGFAERLRPLREGTQQKVVFTTVHQRRDGSLYDVEVHLQLSSFDGRPAFFAVLMDITERKHFEERMHQSQRIEALGTLAGGIAHDFNNLLTAILGYTELSQTMADAGSDVRANLDEVMRAAERARALVRRILAFSHRGPLERRPIDLSELAREALKLIAVSAPASVEIHEDLHAKCRIFGDPNQIHQIVMNLCTNAVHAMQDEKGRLEVGLTAVTLTASQAAQLGEIGAGEYARLIVRDQGHGIDPEALDRIFDPFFTTKKPGEGSGMGLSVVHSIVRSHAGGLSVASEPGSGTTFEIFLPLTEIVSEEETDPTGTPIGSGESVLLVDDDPSVAEPLSQMLQQSGYKVETLCDSELALSHFREHSERFDLVITDYNMPGLKGTELAEQLRRLKPSQTIVMLSGYGDLIDRGEISASGVCEFLCKPVRMQELREVLGRALSGA
jgi:PAS domain S-box-containing protein